MVDNDQIALLEQEVSDELMYSKRATTEHASELAQAELLAQFQERVAELSAYEDKLERRVKIAEKRFTRETATNASLRLENARLVREVDSAREYICELQDAQRKLLLGNASHRLEEGDWSPRLRAGQGLVKAAVGVELSQLRNHAMKLASALEEVSPEMLAAAENRKRLEGVVQRERSRTASSRQVAARALAALVVVLQRKFDTLSTSRTFRTWASIANAHVLRRVVRATEQAYRRKAASALFLSNFSVYASSASRRHFFRWRYNAKLAAFSAFLEARLEPAERPAPPTTTFEKKVEDLVQRALKPEKKAAETATQERNDFLKELNTARNELATELEGHVKTQTLLLDARREADSLKNALQEKEEERAKRTDMDAARDASEAAFDALRDVMLAERRKDLTSLAAGHSKEREQLLAKSTAAAQKVNAQLRETICGERQKHLQTKMTLEDMRARLLHFERQRGENERHDASTNTANQERIEELSAAVADATARVAIAEAAAANRETELRRCQACLKQARSRTLRLAAFSEASEARVTSMRDNLANSQRDRDRLEECVAVEKEKAAAEHVALVAATISREEALRSATSAKDAELSRERDAHDAMRNAVEAIRRERDRVRALETASKEVRDETSSQLQRRVAEILKENEGLRREIEKSATNEDVARLERRARELEEALCHADASRRRLHNSLQDLRGNVRVVARIRPGVDESYISVDADRRTVVLRSPDRTRVDGSTVPSPARRFSFDRVFGQNSTQAAVFEEIEDLVQSAMDGYNVSVLAYGQTGSGKTHTLFGGEGEDGVIPRATMALAKAKSKFASHGWHYDIEASCVEVYDEHVYDLLHSNSSSARGPALQLRDQKGAEEGDDEEEDYPGPRVVGATTVPIVDPACLSVLAKRAASSRATRATAVNDRSSRSHAVFWLRLRGSSERKVTSGSLVLVDLAGSERVARSGAMGECAGDQLREACSINKSLSCLVDVFAALGKKSAGSTKRDDEKTSRFIPFRNSKLTHLLQSSLSGDGKALLLATLSPERAYLSETTCTLRFASQIAKIECGRPTKHVTVQRDLRRKKATNSPRVQVA